ncbi:DNA primase, partial [Salmonella enterica subsp. enterica serovar Lubbock]|nr:DNA primase [Salmonella enterica subsp. enterica serovar Lubbock]
MKDIVKVISSRVELKVQGKNFIGLCPFHNEKTPSFIVNSAKQTFECL